MSSVKESSLALFSTLIEEKMGLHYPKERWGELKKKLIPLMPLVGAADMDACVEELSHCLSEHKMIAELAYYLTIGETYFFRDVSLFEVLEKQIFPQIIAANQATRSLRIWSAGCCTGEEPYSIAMLLHHRFPNLRHWKVLILGTDINEEFLLKARRARYTRWSLRSTPSGMLEKYFILSSDGTYHLDSQIKESVHFATLNLAEGRYLQSGLDCQEMDLILCQNVLIYFSPKQIKHTVGQLTETLKQGGWLSVAAIEVPFIASPYLTMDSSRGVTLFQKREGVPQKIARAPPARPVKTPPVPLESKSIPLPSYEICLNLYQKKQYPLAIQKILERLSPAAGDPFYLHSFSKEMLLLIRAYVKEGDLQQARSWCEKALKANKLDPLFHYLYGEVLFAKGEKALALKALKQAIFLNADFAIAHYLLGLLLEAHDPKLARRHYQFSLKVAHQLPLEEPVLGSEELTASDLCEHLATLLKKGGQSDE